MSTTEHARPDGRRPLSTRGKQSLTAVLTGLLAVAGLTLAGPSHAAATTPPWEPDPISVGTITFYDANGNVITSGKSDVPFAKYAVGSVDPVPGNVQAGLYFANPQPNTTTPFFYKEAVGLFTTYPVTAAGTPTAIKNLPASKPVNVATSDDQTLDGFESDSTPTTAPGYQNVVQIRLRTAPPPGRGGISSAYDSADVMIDPTTHTWTQIYPSPATAPGAPTNVTARAGNAAAVVSWAAPVADGGASITGYTVSYAVKGSSTYKSVVVGAVKSATIPGLTNGVSYVFHVSATNAGGLTGPPSADTAAVTPVADASALAIGAPASVRYGYAATVAARLSDPVTRTYLARVTVTLYGRYGRSGAYHALKNVVTSSAGAASVALRPTSYEQFYWHFAGNATHKPVNSSVRGVTVSQTVTVKATATKVKAKKLIKVYGTVGPVGKGQRVYLQVFDHGWKTVTSAVLSSQTLPNHKRAVGYVLSVRPKKGSKTYRVYKPATSTLLVGYSGQFKLAGT